MAGMDANLTLEQAKKQQERICHTGSEHQGPKSSASSGDSICKKVSHQGK